MRFQIFRTQGVEMSDDRLTFFKEAENMPAYEMARLIDTSIVAPAGAMAAEAALEHPRTANAKSSKRG